MIEERFYRHRARLEYVVPGATSDSVSLCGLSDCGRVGPNHAVPVVTGGFKVNDMAIHLYI